MRKKPGQRLNRRRIRTRQGTGRSPAPATLILQPAQHAAAQRTLPPGVLPRLQSILLAARENARFGLVRPVVGFGAPTMRSRITAQSGPLSPAASPRMQLAR